MTRDDRTTILVPRGQRVPVNQIFVGPTRDTSCCVDNGDGTFTVPETTVNLRDNPNNTGDALPYTLAETTFNSPQGASYAVGSYNGGSPAMLIITDVELITESDVCPLVTVYRDGNELHLLDWDGIASGMANRLHQRTVKTRRFEVEPNGLRLSVNASRNIFITAGRTWHGAVRMALTNFDSTVDDVDLWVLVDGVWSKTPITEYNNTQYNDTTTGLVTLSNKYWTVNWVYRGIEMANHGMVVLADAEYKTAAEANDSGEPTIPDLAIKQYVLVGRILVEKNTTNAIVQSAFVQRFAPGASSDHENLANLLGALIGNHYHFADFATVAAAELAAGALPGAIAHVLAENTWYRYDANPGLTRDGTTVLNTGDGGTSRWVAFAGRWQVYQYDDVFTDNLIVPAGAASPDIIPVPGAPNISAWGFDGVNRIESLSGTVELLHGYRQGTDIWPHVHWSPSDNGTGDVRWVFEYIVGDASNSFEFRAPVILTAIQAAGGLAASGRPIQQNVEFNAPISGLGLTIGSQIRFVIRREPANAADTYGSDAILWASGIHYLKDSAGSLQRFVK